MSADQNGFEACASSHGGVSLKLDLEMQTITGRFPATYLVDETGMAWRAWAIMPAAIPPPVAAGSVDTLTRYRLYFDDSEVVEEADSDGDYVRTADAIAWGAQQREAGKMEAISEMMASNRHLRERAEFAQKQWDNWVASANEWKERAEKAEAERDTLKESLRLVNEDHGLWMTRTHAAEDARDDALARVKELEGEMNRTAAGDTYFDLLPNQIVIT